MPTKSQARKQANFIVLQPDDLPFLEHWTPSAHFPSTNGNNRGGPVNYPQADQLPNIERLRTQGVQMLQAHTASPACGTSRYSTLTGRYPSRSAYSRDAHLRQEDEDVPLVTIPRTKLLDIDTVPDGQDCSENNLAQTFKANGYRTGVVGKWHLYAGDFQGNTFDYEEVQDEIRSCGFDFAEAIYPENLQGAWTQTYPEGVSIDHNMYVFTTQLCTFLLTLYD